MEFFSSVHDHLSNRFYAAGLFTQGIPHVHSGEGVAKGHFNDNAFVVTGVWGMGFPVSIRPRNKSVTK